MKCLHCAAEIYDRACPACGVRPAPENVMGYNLLPRPPFNPYRAGRRVMALASRTWGAHHRFLSGKDFEADEHELYRTRLQSLAAFTVDHQTRVALKPVCIVTDRRMLIQDTYGHDLEVRRSSIRAVAVQRTDDPLTGPSYFLAVKRIGSAIHDTRGDLSLYCRQRQDCEKLAAALS